METDILRGSCLCGAVQFELTAPPSELLHCHCRMCRKAHGASYATFARFDHADFHVLEGADRIATYRSSETVRRTFCSVCGSSLQFVRDGKATFGLAASTLDTPLARLPVRQYHTESRVDWL